MWPSLVAILGVLSCPTAAQIDGELAHTRGSQPAPAGESVRVRGSGTELEIDLQTENHHASRTVPRPDSCAEAARLIATLVIAWETELEVTPLTLNTSLALPSPSLSVASPSLAVTAVRPALPRRVDYDVGAAFVASLANADFAPGAVADARLTRRGFPLAGYFGFLGEATRTLPLGGDHSVRWTRAALRFGASWRFLLRSVSFDLTAGGALALFYAQGARFTHSLRVFDADFSLGTGLRVGVRTGRVRPFLGVELSGWLNKQRLQSTDNPPGSVDIPQLETLFTAGLALTN